MIDEKLAEKIVDFLNELMLDDKDAVQALFDSRVQCNKALANHPTVQVLNDNGKYSVSILGILNGIVGSRENGWGAIASVHNVSCPKCKEPKEKSGDMCDTCNVEACSGEIVKFEALEE